MIKTRKQFEERLKELKEEAILRYSSVTFLRGYGVAIDDVLKIIEGEGGCFKE